MIKTASITDLKQNTAQIIKKLQKDGGSVVILQRSQPAAILVDPDHYAALEEALETAEDLRAIEERKNEPTIPFEEVAKKLGLK
jgi:prevent-host-death family protein